MRSLCTLLWASGLFLAALPAFAQSSASEVALGHRLAQQHCSQCHTINGAQSWTDAPSFADIANRPTTSRPSLLAVITRPHVNMLYLPRTEPDAAALAAYILSLRHQTN